MPNNIFILVTGFCLAIGIAFSGWFVGEGFLEGRKADRYVTVKGVAEQEAKADLAIWALRFVATGDDLTAVQQKIAADSTTVRDFLINSDFKAEEIENRDLQVVDRLAQQYRQGEVDSRFIIAQTVALRTADVDRVADTFKRIGELVATGLVLSDENQWAAGPTYIFTGLNDLKPAMIAEATKNARAGAEQFAADSGSTVGGIRRANQGVFVIRPRDQIPGANEAKQIYKTVRVVSTIEFSLQD